MMMNAIEAFEIVRRDAEKIRNDQPQRFPEAASDGDYFRQGDLYVTRLAGVPPDATPAPMVRQLAAGNTQGARHILDSEVGVVMYRRRNADALTGPVIEVCEQRIITHPEHGDVILPIGVYAITYQRAFADELRRVRD